MGVIPENRLLIGMAIPTIISMLIQASYNIVDSAFVARIGENALTAVFMTFPVQSLMIAFSIGIGVGMTQLLSRSLGEKDHDSANRAAAHGVLLMAAVCLIFVFFELLFSRKFFIIQNVDSSITALGESYLFITTVFSLGLFMQFAFERMLIATGKTVYPMISHIAVAALNIVFDPILIFGLLGFPALGVTGAAIATVFSQSVSVILAFVFHLSFNREIKIHKEHFRPRKLIIKQIWIIGSSAIVKQASGSITLFCVNNIFLAFTPTATAVYGAFYRLYVFFITPVWALTNTLIPLAAYNLGMKKQHRILNFFKLSILYCLGITLPGVAVISIWPQQFLALFNATGEMKRIGMIAFPILCVFLPFQGCSTVIISALQGLGAGKTALVAGIGERLLFPLITAYLLALTEVLEMIWWSFAVAEFIGLIVCSLLMRQVYRAKIKPRFGKNFSAGDDPPRITIEDYFEHDLGGIGGSALVVVREGGVEGAEVQLVDQVVHGVLEGAGYELLVEANGKEQPLGFIKVFIAGHIIDKYITGFVI
jgi:putative MATE family efflux protein